MKKIYLFLALYKTIHLFFVPIYSFLYWPVSTQIDYYDRIRETHETKFYNFSANCYEGFS